MENRKITYGRLEEALLGIGYSVETRDKVVVFRHRKTQLPVILRRMTRNEPLQPLDVLSVENALANGGVIAKDEFESLFPMEPIELWHAIIDAKAEYESQNGRPPNVLKLPVVQAYELAKLSREDLGPLSEEVMRNGIRAFEKVRLLDMRVKLVPGTGQFVFE